MIGFKYQRGENKIKKNTSLLLDINKKTLLAQLHIHIDFLLIIGKFLS